MKVKITPEEVANRIDLLINKFDNYDKLNLIIILNEYLNFSDEEIDTWVLNYLRYRILDSITRSDIRGQVLSAADMYYIKKGIDVNMCGGQFLKPLGG